MFLQSACIHQKEDFKPVSKLFNDDWEFVIADDSLLVFSDDSEWQTVKLPHTPVIEPIIVNDQWQGTCWYRKKFLLDKKFEHKNLFLKFEGAMNVAEVWVNGEKKIRHQGGYLPFTIDFTLEALPGDTNVVLVRLDNRDNPVTGPKPLEILDFNMYGGLYRDVSFFAKNDVFITDPILENRTAGGGLFVRFPQVSQEQAVVEVQVHLRNTADRNADLSIVHQLWMKGEMVIESKTAEHHLDASTEAHYTSTLEVKDPSLWSPESPALYTLVTHIFSGGTLKDADTLKIGIKKIEFHDNRFVLNGKEPFLRGVNRHQEYPYVGYALSNEAQYREAIKIKEAGFDYVRLSHYPHSPAFMEACDEIGLIVIDAILGWQYYVDDPAFQRHVYQTCRDLIRRDRNHACVLAWEVSLNESWMPEPFIDSLTAIAHEEYPGKACYTAGWQEYGYDIYLQARQHRLDHYHPPMNPYVVSEYGDWEYYAMNAGLNQDSWQDLRQIERSSRQLLSDGEERLLQQATNIQEAHNDNFNTPAFADGYWVMFDYNRGYADDLEASGIMSINRLPKFSYFFFRSQRGPDERSSRYSSGPMAFIASCWNQHSDAEVRVFSNCEEVELWLNGSLIGRQSPDNDRISGNLAHPPFTFTLDRFEPGSLTAVGYIEGEESVRFERRTPEQPAGLRVWLDESGAPPKAGVNDVLFLHAAITDSNGTVVPVNGALVEFECRGDGALVSPGPVSTEAGIATALIRIGDHAGEITVLAKSEDLPEKTLTFTTEK
jgi:beta-galactosidase